MEGIIRTDMHDKKKTKRAPDSVLPSPFSAMPYILCLTLLFLSHLKSSVIGLSFVLALGFLLVIMSCALYGYVTSLWKSYLGILSGICRWLLNFD